MQQRLFFVLFVIALSLHFFPLFSQDYKVIEEQAHLPILTPSFSQKQTLKLKLANGLEAYLISDPLATQSGAVLTVEAGSWDDPQEYPGLAHFLEHLLFLGTEKYPLESDYTRFIHTHNGQSNAYTASAYTLYLFSINHQAFEEALDRFSSFFKAPLFNPSGVARELQAIDQEFAKNLTNDKFRENAVQKELGNPLHPYHRFSAGNSLTLSHVSQHVLKQWYQDHYSANLMRLIVYAPLPIQTLKELVLKDFSEIPDKALQPIRPSTPLLADQRKASLTYITPITDLRALRLTWELPSDIDPQQLYKPESLICYVLGHEGPGSLLAELKTENLAEELGCSGYRLGAQPLLFSIYITLTEEGLKKVDTVIERCFGAIKMLQQKDFPLYLFEEVKKIASIRYQYQPKEDPFDYLMKLGGWLAQENLATFPELTLIPQSFNSLVVHHFLDYLTPQNVHIHILSDPKTLLFPLTKKEQWMNIAYDTQLASSEQIKRWTQATAQPNLYLPTPNPFIPTQLKLNPLIKDNSIEQALIPHPTVLVDTEEAKIYFAKDVTFQMPQTVWFFEVQTPEMEKGKPVKEALSALYIKSLQEALIPFSYPAQLADLEYEIDDTQKGLLITIKGYSDKVENLFDTLLHCLKDCRPSEQLFQTLKQSLLRSYQNEDRKSALQQGLGIFKSILYQNFATHTQKIEALQPLSYQDFLAYIDHLYDQTYVRGLLYGHMEKEQAHQIWNKLHKTLESRLFPKAARPVERILVLPGQNGPYLLEKTIDTPAHAVILAIEEPLFSFKTRAAQQVLSQGMSSAFYSTLRTQQQTGYLVFNNADIFAKHLFSFFAVQSHTHPPRDLLARFELFIETFLQEMTKTELTAEQFEQIRQALLVNLNQPPQNLMEMGELLKTLAFDYEGDFDWINKRIQGLKELTYEEFLEIAVQFLGKENKRRLAILIKGIIPTQKIFEYIPLKNAEEMRKLSQYTYIKE